REAALRTEREAIERDERRRFLDPRLQILDGLHPLQLRAHESEDDDAPVGDVAERLERARPLVVVLQQEAIELRASEHLRRDAIVAARRVEHALVVAAADVDAESDARMALDDRVV